MTPLPFQDVGHAIPFWFAYGIWVALEIVRSFTRRSKPGSRRDDRGSYSAVVGGTYLGMGFAFFLAFNEPGTAFLFNREALYELGVALMIVGVAFRAYAVRTLGRSFTFDVATHADQSVCEVGPYRYIRHPAYAGSFMTIAGVGLALGNWGSLLAALAVATATFSYRIGIEEKVLCRDLGATYVAYMKRTRRLIPFLF